MSTKKTTKTKPLAVKGAARTAARKEALLAALEESRGIISVACRATSINRDSYYEWLKDEEFARRVHEIQQSQLDFVESKLLQRIDAGDTVAAIFYLKTRGKERGYTERTELTGAGGKALVPDIKIEVVDAQAADE
nr:hypothetical protein [uncultured Porphyromonas sp.]